MTAKLIACPACHNQVSADAWKCPGCGHPLRRAGGRAFKYLAVGAVAVGAAWCLWASRSASQATINGPLHVETIPPAAK